mmetsp:Transcript_19025/g.34389  ORF Transcript_19025/g.34389 Transcript_19025/m.34389 type:complete len:484 (-) Transcript_19025:21-1472(-)
MPSVIEDAEQVHVSITGTDRVVVSWASQSGSIANLFIEEVAKGDHPLQGTLQTLRPNTTEYRLKDKFGEPGLYQSPKLLHCEVQVRPRASYRFAISSSLRISPSFGGWRLFHTPPAPGATEQLRLAIVGDLGQTTYSAATCASLRARHAEERFDAAILVGDLAYADGSQARWDSFGRMFDEKGCADVPWLVLPGNHEIDVDDLTQEAFIPYRNRWRTPAIAPEEVSTFEVLSWSTYSFRGRYDYGGSFWSIRLGPVHFIALNPYTDAGEDSLQIQWLRQELEQVNRTLTPHLVVLTHAPWHHSSVKHQPRSEEATSQLMSNAEPLLLSAQADLMFAGHVHAYERLEPISGMRHFIVGHGGNHEKLYDNWDIIPESLYHDGTKYGWGELQLAGENGSYWLAWSSVDRKLQEAVRLEATSHTRAEPEFQPVGTQSLPALLLLVALLAAAGFGMGFWSQYNRRKQRLLGTRQRSFSEHTRVIGAQR